MRDDEDFHQQKSKKYTFLYMSGNFWASSCLAMPWSLIIFCQAVGLLFYDEVRVVEVPQVADSSTKSKDPRPSNLLPRQHKMPCHPLRCHVVLSMGAIGGTNGGCVSKTTGPKFWVLYCWNEPISGNLVPPGFWDTPEFHKFLTVRPPFWPKRSLWQRQIASRMRCW